MLRQENQVEITSKNSDNNHNPLNEHDYCSPSKFRLSRPEESNQPLNETKTIKLDHSQMHASDSLPPESSLTSDAGAKNTDSDVATTNIANNFSNDNLNDLSSSSSSSLSSSFESSKELIIAQDSNKVDLLKSKNRLSLSSRKHKHPIGGEMEQVSYDQEKNRVRAKRARQSTSVTDKSEWIMGDDQIDSVLSEHLDEGRREKRRKSHKELDDEFTQLSSSDYSESGAEADSDQDSEYNSEDDPDKLWCVCRKPHDGKFMICCDVCKDWFHGHCVGVTRLMGDRFEKQGKEWYCAECRDKLKAGIPRTAIPMKIVKKESKKKKPPVPEKRRRGRPRKSETIVREGEIRVSQRNLRKSSSSLDHKIGVDNSRLKKNLARSEARSESFDEFENSQKLKELIKERKKEFFYKRHLAEQQRASKRNELGLNRQSLTANLSHSLDSLASSTSTPNMNNLPTNIKSEHKERSKPNIVLQINTKKDPGTAQDNSSSRIVTTIVRSSKKSKHIDSNDPVVNDLFTAEPIQINKKVKVQDSPASTNQTSSDTAASNGDLSMRKRSNSSSLNPKHDKSSTEHGSTTPKKKRKDSESSTPNGSSTPGGSKYIAQKIKDSLETRSKQIKDLEVSPCEIEKLAMEIEGQLNECFKEGTQKYLNKFRSLIFNLRDPKNQGLVKNVLSGEILPSRLVRMSPDEMASHELAKWRERENKHSIELIKRDAQLAAQQVIVKKTHKGEEVISAPLLKDSEDPSGEADSNESATTPTKLTTKECRGDGPKVTTTQPAILGVSKSVGTLKMKITGTFSDSSALRAANQESNSSAPSKDSLPFLETTIDHKNHIFDINCKICTKEVDETSELNSSNKPEVSTSDQDQKTSESDRQKQQSDQPKRFRVSIDTKLDPANLSRLKEPLIKPSQQSSMDLDEEPARTPPFHQSNDEDDDGVESNHDFSSVFNETSTTPPGTSKEPCWTGCITMPDTAKFSATARLLNGSVDFFEREIEQSLIVCGRITPDHMQGYIRALKSTKNEILIIQLFPLTEDDKSNFDTFFDYLYKRNRYGVIRTNHKTLKDFYVLPIHENSSLPDILRPLKGSEIDRKDPNCLLGLLVRGIEKVKSYTPTPLSFR